MFIDELLRIFYHHGMSDRNINLFCNASLISLVHYRTDIIKVTRGCVSKGFPNYLKVSGGMSSLVVSHSGNDGQTGNALLPSGAAF